MPRIAQRFRNQHSPYSISLQHFFFSPFYISGLSSLWHVAIENGVSKRFVAQDLFYASSFVLRSCLWEFHSSNPNEKNDTYKMKWKKINFQMQNWKKKRFFESSSLNYTIFYAHRCTIFFSYLLTCWNIEFISECWYL